MARNRNISLLELETTPFDVIIIGGSYAGLSAALSLGRSRRRTLIIDSGKRCNAQTPHSHNFITQDGVPPGRVAEQALTDVLKYDTVDYLEGLATYGIQTGNGFKIQTAAGNTFIAKRLIFATGLKDLLPEINGLAACWGISVIHCPYCHGFENQDKKTALFGNSARVFHLATLVRQLTNDISIVCTNQNDFSEEQLATLKKHSFNIIESDISEIQHKDGKLSSLCFTNGSKETFDAVYAAIPFEQHCSIPQQMGCSIDEHGYIETDHFHQTSIPGVYACGDNSSMMRAVAKAVYAGNLTGAAVNSDLAHEDFYK